jgi:hypothetical protein
MRMICWSAAVVTFVALTAISCGNLPRYACVDQSHPCDYSDDLDAGADGDAADQ